MNLQFLSLTAIFGLRRTVWSTARIAALACGFVATGTLCAQVPLTPGNLVVERIGSGFERVAAGADDAGEAARQTEGVDPEAGQRGLVEGACGGEKNDEK